MRYAEVFSYRGSSMAGTFNPGDSLFVSPATLQHIRLGDVVVFYAAGRLAGIIVHRVIARTQNGLVTRGDACSIPDTEPVQVWNLVGRVVEVQRGNKPCVVLGGFAGRLWARYVRLRRRLLALGRMPYRWLRASGIVRHLWRPHIAHVELSTKQGMVVKYLCRGETVAVWQPEKLTYWCRKPYDLVLDAPVPTTNG